MVGAHLRGDVSGLGAVQRWLLAVLCVAVGIACLEGRAFGSPAARGVYGAVAAAILLGVTLAVRSRAREEGAWQLPFAFFVFAVVQLLNNTLPELFMTGVLGERPVPGNPLGSTVGGTIAVQLLETAIAIVPILVLTALARVDRSEIYATVGRAGPALVIAMIAFVAFAVIAGVIPLHRLFPTHGAMTIARYMSLLPALLVLVVSNGFQEEFLFRGLFLKRYGVYFGAIGANVVQALVFAAAHAGVSYTPITLIFLLVFVFPLGLVAGYLMRSSNGMLAPAIFHAGADIPIYLAFLTFVS